MPWLLNAVYSLVLILTLPIWVYKAITTGKYREGLWRKLAGAPPVLNPNSRVLWFHAVSVGEVGLLRPLLERVTSQFPAHQIVLSTSTNSGYKFAKEKYPTIKIFYAPFDVMRRLTTFEVQSFRKSLIVVIVDAFSEPGI